MSRVVTSSLALLGAAVLVLLGAAPASADHFSGMEGTERCERGNSASGGPSTNLYTTDVAELRYRGSLTMICYFGVPEFIPVCEDCMGAYKGDWTAPSRPQFARDDYCFAPGTISGSISPGGLDARAADRTLAVFYRTHAVLTCYWQDDPTDDPGYWG
ncbi:hypothetical protein FVA74_05400 [Salinibacterium sp. dk2585]|uniref:hypothetical protein n=1 Tax=unclassified Salinibacterium TaxID=2632331 RepID=UPI0011C2557C|nr:MULTISPECIES: hypothetical protein [unclassified Salinibacterium]QEE61075.1 hypothetical protein FVA74_05400 [Salinibacterium sp. dk2585]TXK53017.1 hypothetical protein FVP63_11520 [Salinibacterium sp. dk5596]